MIEGVYNDFAITMNDDDDVFHFSHELPEEDYTSFDSLNHSGDEDAVSFKYSGSEDESNVAVPEFFFDEVEFAANTVRSEEKSRPYECSFTGVGCDTPCGRRFTKLAHLKAHYMTHTGERPFKCTEPECGKSFTQLSTLKNHLLTHSGDKQHACPHEGCSKRFSRPSTLRNHLNTHITERKTFVCMFEGCTKQFTQVSSLRTHLRTHTGEKPFLCPVDGCGRMFNRQSNRKRHLATHLPKQKRSKKDGECSHSHDDAMMTVVSVPVNEDDNIFIMPEINKRTNPINLSRKPVSSAC